jgi:hypothetical protein
MGLLGQIGGCMGYLKLKHYRRCFARAKGRNRRRRFQRQVSSGVFAKNDEKGSRVEFGRKTFAEGSA